MVRERFGAPGCDLSTDFRRLRLANFLAFWGQQYRSTSVGEGDVRASDPITPHVYELLGPADRKRNRAPSIADLGSAPTRPMPGKERRLHPLNADQPPGS